MPIIDGKLVPSNKSAFTLYKDKNEKIQEQKKKQNDYDYLGRSRKKQIEDLVNKEIEMLLKSSVKNENQSEKKIIRPLFESKKPKKENEKLSESSAKEKNQSEKKIIEDKKPLNDNQTILEKNSKFKVYLLNFNNSLTIDNFDPTKRTIKDLKEKIQAQTGISTESLIIKNYYTKKQLDDNAELSSQLKSKMYTLILLGKSAGEIFENIKPKEELNFNFESEKPKGKTLQSYVPKGQNVDTFFGNKRKKTTVELDIEKEVLKLDEKIENSLFPVSPDRKTFSL